MRGIYDPNAAGRQRLLETMAKKSELEQERQMLIDALMACHEALSEYDIPITLPDQVKFALAKAGAIK